MMSIQMFLSVNFYLGAGPDLDGAKYPADWCCCQFNRHDRSRLGGRTGHHPFLLSPFSRRSGYW